MFSGSEHEVFVPDQVRAVPAGFPRGRLRRNTLLDLLDHVLRVVVEAVAAEALAAALDVVREHRRDHVPEVADQHHLARARVELPHHLRDAVDAVLLGEETRSRDSCPCRHLRVDRLDPALAERRDLADCVDVHPVREASILRAARQRRLLTDPPRAVDAPGRVDLAAVADRVGERGHHAEPVRGDPRLVLERLTSDDLGMGREHLHEDGRARAAEGGDHQRIDARLVAAAQRLSAAA